ncbi:MAG TPA: hypothetical protein VGC97_13175 [Pyrinomonadaceae bacterium]|jgi:hypothetical protein
MVKLSLGTYSLFLPIVFWGVLLGGIVYSHIVFFPVFLSDLPDSSVVVNGTYGLTEAPFWILTHSLLLVSLSIALAFNWKFRERRKLILTSFSIYIVVLIVSTLYFVPELIAFSQSPKSNLSSSEWLSRSNRWQYLSWIRGAVCFLSFLPLLVALAKTESNSREPESSAVSN